MSPRTPYINGNKAIRIAPKDSSVSHRRQFTRQRLEYCDCGNLAVTVLRVRVGIDPQYIIRMPLCLSCLKLEQELE